MSVEIFQDQFGSLQHYPDEAILELRWSADTAAISDDDFKRWMMLLGDHATSSTRVFWWWMCVNLPGRPAGRRLVPGVTSISSRFTTKPEPRSSHS